MHNQLSTGRVPTPVFLVMDDIDASSYTSKDDSANSLMQVGNSLSSLAISSESFVVGVRVADGYPDSTRSTKSHTFPTALTLDMDFEGLKGPIPSSQFPWRSNYLLVAITSLLKPE